MRSHRAWILVVLAVSLLVLPPAASVDVARAQEDEGEMEEGFHADMLFWLEDAREKLMALAEATPEDKYGWRPMEGVRSQGEVFLHVAASNYGIASQWGVPPPEGFSFQGYGKSIEGKENIMVALNESFDHMEKGFRGLSEDEMNKKVNVFGNDVTIRWGYLVVLSHAHEHLGQSIAYARSNEIVPPWSASADSGDDAEDGEE